MKVSGSHDEGWRTPRIMRTLLRVSKVLSERAKSRAVQELYGNIEAIYDHKGFLNVTWKRKPSMEEREVFSTAWEQQNEDFDSVEHQWPGKPDDEEGV